MRVEKRKINCHANCFSSNQFTVKFILTYFGNKLQGKKNLSFYLQGENDTPKNHSFPIGREFY